MSSLKAKLTLLLAIFFPSFFVYAGNGGLGNCRGIGNIQHGCGAAIVTPNILIGTSQANPKQPTTPIPIANQLPPQQIPPQMPIAVPPQVPQQVPMLVPPQIPQIAPQIVTAPPQVPIAVPPQVPQQVPMLVPPQIPQIAPQIVTAPPQMPMVEPPKMPQVYVRRIGGGGFVKLSQRDVERLKREGQIRPDGTVAPYLSNIVFPVEQKTPMIVPPQPGPIEVPNLQSNNPVPPQIPQIAPQMVTAPPQVPMAVPPQVPQQVPMLVPPQIPQIAPQIVTAPPQVFMVTPPLKQQENLIPLVVIKQNGVTKKPEPNTLPIIEITEKGNSALYNQNMITFIPGRQSSDNYAIFKNETTGAYRECVVSGLDRRKIISSGGEVSYLGTLPSFRTVSIEVADIPSWHPHEAGCIISLQHKEK